MEQGNVNLDFPALYAMLVLMIAVGNSQAQFQPSPRQLLALSVTCPAPGRDTNTNAPAAIINRGAAGLERLVERNALGRFASTKTVAERFWEKVDKRGLDECWPWMGNRNPDGYGKLRIGDEVVKAHRVAWMLMRGAIPKGMHVLHHCDSPACCNAKRHLFLGTHADNMADMKRKGRASGDSRANTKITWADADEIRRLNYAGMPRKEIAGKFRVHLATIGRIVTMKRWVRNPQTAGGRDGEA